MKTFTKNTLAVAVAASLVSAGMLWAADKDATTAKPLRDTNQSRQRGVEANPAARLVQHASTTTMRASELIGMNIQNPQEESVGEVNDLVVDTRNGKLRYAAVTYGGFLGVGDKMFAVPWDAFRIEQDGNDPGEYHLVLNVSERQLEGAQGFDQDHWPNFADHNFTDDLDARYGVRRAERDRVDVDVNRRGVNVDVGGRQN
ncbi:MAG: PRC-barrel domain-containing protein [Pirellulales bacterium]